MLEAKVLKKQGTFILDSYVRDEGMICLSGKNGSGKSTFLSCIAGLNAMDAGFVKVGGVDVTRLPVEKRGIVLVTPDSYIPHLSVKIHLRWGANVRKLQLNEKEVEEVTRRLGVSYAGRVDKLSLGMRERVSLATALLSSPKLICVDEAFSNIDNRIDFMQSFKAICGLKGLDSIFSTQDPDDSRIADHHYVIDQGKAKRVF